MLCSKTDSVGSGWTEEDVEIHRKPQKRTLELALKTERTQLLLGFLKQILVGSVISLLGLEKSAREHSVGT